MDGAEVANDSRLTSLQHGREMDARAGTREQWHKDQKKASVERAMMRASDGERVSK